MTSVYRHNHFVPEWYQRLFIDPNRTNKVLCYLDLKPETFRDSRGVIHQKKSLRRTGTRQCFAQDDLYTTNFNQISSTNIEQYFFGKIDTNGRSAVHYFLDFMHPSVNEDALFNLLFYMSAQKLRTPKGLRWLSEQAGSSDQNQILRLMLNLKQMYCSIWAECVWQIADASGSETKFIISDHPVTVYNRTCGPRAERCRGANDPDIRYHATHTIFPLSLEKVLILTNLSWVRNPYQKETGLRPNPDLYRDAIFNFLDIQVLRHMSEQEVREVNFIIKSRAYRYIAADKEEWLYPDAHISKSDWNTYGSGYLLMPDPRPIHAGGEIIIGYKSGTSAAFDSYGRRPGQTDYNKESVDSIEFTTLHRFKGEFAELLGPYRRGRSYGSCSLDNEIDSEEYHQYHLGLKKKRRRS